MEWTLFRRRLAVGAALVRRLFVTRAAVRPAEPVTSADGVHLTDHEQRSTTYDSVLGQVRFARPDFTAPGQAGRGPLDAELSVPARGYADRRREGAV